MAAEEGTETRGILTTAPQQRAPTLRTYSRKKSSNKLPSLKPSQKQYPVRPLQQVQLNLRVTKRAGGVSKPTESPPSSRIEVAIPENPSFDPHDYDDAYIGGDEGEDFGGNGEEGEESESDKSLPDISIKKKKGHTVFIPPRAGRDVYNIPDDEPEDSEVPQENDTQFAVIPDSGRRINNHTQVVIPAKAPHFTQRMTRGRPPSNGPRRPHLIFNKLPTRNRFKKLPKKADNQRQTSALRSNPGDGFSDNELKRSGLVLPIRSGKQTTSDAHVGELDISRAPPLPKHRGDKRRTNLGDNSFDIRPRKKTKHTQEQAISILHLPRPHSTSSTPPRTIPTQIVIPALRQNHQPRSRVIIHPPTSEEDDSENDSAYTPDNDDVVIPKSNDLAAVAPATESGDQQENSSGCETYISETSTGGQRSSSVPVEKNQVENADPGVQVTQGLATRGKLKRCATQ
ncbi:hypothetical protein QBC40DRAFT_327418, partial [Triangularia verruculosa]